MVCLYCLVTNFAQLDGVFLTDCPICAANLKRMWCEYACNPDKASFCKSFLPIYTKPNLHCFHLIVYDKGHSPAPKDQGDIDY